MKIAIISDSPTLPTGFARTTRLLAEVLTSIGHHQVVCYGIDAIGETFDRTLYPYTIWAAGSPHGDHASQFDVFVRNIKPDIVIVNYDLLTTLAWLPTLKTSGVTRLIAHLVIDGLPVDPVFLRPLDAFEAIIVPVTCVGSEVRRHVRVPVHVFPHLVDCSLFKPLDGVTLERRARRGSPLVGVFAKNRPRKQIQQILQAVRQLYDDGYPCELMVRTDQVSTARDGGDNLRRIARYLSIEDYVTFVETGDIVDVASDARPGAASTGPSSLSLHEDMARCDVIVNSSACGGFEYGIIEAQACGVPVCSTADQGAMSEVAGDSTLLLTPSLFDFISYGAKWYRLSPEVIADAIRHITSDAKLRCELVERGFSNAARFDRSTNTPELVHLLSHLVAGSNIA